MRSRPAALREGFTLIELLTVLAIIGILFAILVPVVGGVQERSRRTVDQSNLRQIGQAAILFATDNNNRLPPSAGVDANGNLAGTANTTIYTWAAALAQSGGINDARLYFSASDPAVPATTPSTVLTQSGTTRIINATFSGSPMSFQVVSGLVSGDASTTPVAFTRGLQTGGTWAANTGSATPSVYGDAGGHIVYLGGNVQFYRNLAGANRLTANTGNLTSNLVQAIPVTRGIILTPAVSGVDIADRTAGTAGP